MSDQVFQVCVPSINLEWAQKRCAVPITNDLTPTNELPEFGATDALEDFDSDFFEKIESAPQYSDEYVSADSQSVVSNVPGERVSTSSEANLTYADYLRCKTPDFRPCKISVCLLPCSNDDVDFPFELTELECSSLTLPALILPPVSVEISPLPPPPPPPLPPLATSPPLALVPTPVSEPSPTRQSSLQLPSLLTPEGSPSRLFASVSPQKPCVEPERAAKRSRTVTFNLEASKEYELAPPCDSDLEVQEDVEEEEYEEEYYGEEETKPDLSTYFIDSAYVGSKTGYVYVNSSGELKRGYYKSMISFENNVEDLVGYSKCDDSVNRGYVFHTSMPRLQIGDVYGYIFVKSEDDILVGERNKFRYSKKGPFPIGCSEGYFRVEITGIVLAQLITGVPESTLLKFYSYDDDMDVYIFSE